MVDMEHVYTGDHYYIAEKDGARVSYKHKDLPAGTYGIYRWSVGEKHLANPEGENCWERFATYTQESEGTFNFAILLNEGQKASSVLLLKED